MKPILIKGDSPDLIDLSPENIISELVQNNNDIENEKIIEKEL